MWAGDPRAPAPARLSAGGFGTPAPMITFLLMMHPSRAGEALRHQSG